MASEKILKILIIYEDGSSNILTCHRETFQRTVAEAINMVKAVEPRPLETSVLEGYDSILTFDHHLCIGCGKRIGNRRARTDIAYCGRCRRKNNKSPR